MTPAKLIADFKRAVAAGEVDTMAPLLPLFKLKGEHLSTLLHYQMAPMFKLQQPMDVTYCCSRQVGKTTGLALQAILRGMLVPGFDTVVIEPRYDQLTRFNSTILKPLFRSSPARDLIISRGEIERMGIRELLSGSLIYLEFALLSPDRARGISGSASTLFDETQDLEYDFIPVIKECMSASRRWGFAQYTGTPKTTDGTLGVLWEDSSQAEWVIPCQSCGKHNVPALDQDIIKMVGKKTLVCAKCDKPLDARTGAYVHAFPDRYNSRPGYHFSQVTHPLHYSLPHKWASLRGKMEGPGSYSKAKFYNEVLGVPCDESVKLLTRADIKRASDKKRPNTLTNAMDLRSSYDGYVMGVDWSGGGDLSDSYTSIAVVGFKLASEVLDCVYARRLETGMSPEEEADILLDLYLKLRCGYFAHDYGGAGYVRESVMRQAGLPDAHVVPFTYTHSALKDIVVYNPPNIAGARHSYSLDKARSLAVLCSMIRNQKVTLPNYNKDSTVPMDDLLALVELPKELPRGNVLYLIGRAPKRPDDFAHALNYACTAIWHTRQAYPDLSRVSERFKASKELLDLANPLGMDELI